jgi:hypothetical protein
MARSNEAGKVFFTMNAKSVSRTYMARITASSLISSFVLILALLTQGLPNARAQESCPLSPLADIMFLIDTTASINGASLTKEKNAVKAVADALIALPGPVNARVAAIRFGCDESKGYCSVKDEANLVSLLGYNAAYLKTNVDAIQDPKGTTNLKKAILAGRNHLLQYAGNPTKRFIILISDGHPNMPGSGQGVNGEATSEAIAARNAAIESGITILTAHFGAQFHNKDAGGQNDGIAFLKNKIASSPDLAVESGADLVAALLGLLDKIICDDQDLCTIDTCDMNTQSCLHLPVTTVDTDGDTVDDCHDLCVGDDTLIGTACTKPFGQNPACIGTGVYSCSTGTLTCEATSPGGSPEQCNGVDDDCDSSVDEGLDTIGDCTVGVGVCQKTGNLKCENGAPKCDANPGNAQTEICNALDDDCDGVPDDNIAPTGSCSAGIGACLQSGQFVCVNGTTICSAQSGTGSAEVCNGIDDDCDGLTDENATSEICNGVDDDCDGAVDEGFGVGVACSEGIGACNNTGVTVCGGPNSVVCSAQPLPPTGEECDLVDNDCDGLVDEDGACDCTETSVADSQALIDGNSFAQYKLAQKLAKYLTKINPKVSKAAKDTVKQIQDLHMEIWFEINVLVPPVIQDCPELICESVSLEATLDSILAKTIKIGTLEKALVKKAGALKDKKAKSYLNKNTALTNSTKSEIQEVPSDMSICE